jgi:hypothetical protein
MIKKKRRQLEAMQPEAMPTAERLRHAGDAFEIGGSSGRGKRIFRMLDAPIEQLLKEGKLNDAQYEVLRLMRVHWWLGSLSGNLRSTDLNRLTMKLPHDETNLTSVERGLMHREAFYCGWSALDLLQKTSVNSVVLIEQSLTATGADLGYASPYRGRAAVLEYLRGAAAQLMDAWRG